MKRHIIHCINSYLSYKTTLRFDFPNSFCPVRISLISATQNPEISRFSTEHAYNYKTKRRAKRKREENKMTFLLASWYLILLVGISTALPTESMRQQRWVLESIKTSIAIDFSKTLFCPIIKSIILLFQEFIIR